MGRDICSHSVIWGSGALALIRHSALNGKVASVPESLQVHKFVPPHKVLQSGYLGVSFLFKSNFYFIVLKTV